MRDSEVLVTHHKALMELSHNTSFIEMPRPRKLAASWSCAPGCWA